MPREKVVYVITDAAERDPWRKLGQQIREVLRPTALIGVIAAPLMAVTALPVGLLLGWHPFLIFCAAVIGGPVLVNLVDLLAARFGLPPLAWVATRIIARHPALNPKENRRNG